MVGFIAIAVCFLAASRLHGFLESFAIVCGIVQMISWWSCNRLAQFELEGGRAGPGDAIVMLILSVTGLLGSFVSLVLLIATLM